MSTVLRAVLDLRTVTPEELALWRAQLDAEKRARVERLRRAESQKQTICADHLARELLLQAGARPQQLRFCYTPLGKPFCPDSGLQFSLSHSGNFVLCVVAETEVGADLETLRAIRPALAARVCSAGELEYVCPQGNFDSTRFLTLWTAKEAYLKYTGQGIATDLRRIEAANADGLFSRIFGLPLLHEQTAEYVSSIVTEY